MIDTIRLFVGWDKREEEGGLVFLKSLLSRTTQPLELTFLTEAVGERLGIASDGTNSFSKIRFVVPWMCGFKGRAIYLDCVDMLLLAPLEELWALADGSALQVAPHDYKTRHPKKYVGEPMEAANLDYPRKNQSSCMIWDNAYYPHRVLTPEFIAKQPGSFLHRFEWIKDQGRIGNLPLEWNWLCDEYGDNPEAKLLHWTAGAPFMAHYKDSPMSNHWHESARTWHSER